MTYYLTSKNVKTLRKLILDFNKVSHLTPLEFIIEYLDNPSETEDTDKLSWIAETFLSYKKHELFLLDVVSILPKEVPEDEQDYFMIILHAVTFQIQPYTDSFYKCMVNLSKSFLKLFTNYLSDGDKITCIGHLAEECFDKNYVTEKIIKPLLIWQPYMKNMANKYDEAVKRSMHIKKKALTVPQQPNVLNRKKKEKPFQVIESTGVVSTNNDLEDTIARLKSAEKLKKMLTKSTIDLRLQQSHEKNKQEADRLLNIVKKTGQNDVRRKSDDHFKRTRTPSVAYQMYDDRGDPIGKQKRKIVLKEVSIPIKETKTYLKRINKRIQEAEQGELVWFNQLVKSCYCGTIKYEELETLYREEQKKERLYDIQRKHLVVQLSHEDAIIAKEKQKEIAKQKYEEFMKEKAAWNEEIEIWKKNELHKNSKQIENLSLLELSILEAKNNVSQKKKEKAEQVKNETALLKKQVLKIKNEELEHRINMIKEIRMISLVAKQTKVPKIIDLTETSGFGFLCEMSIAELQERLSAMKISIKEELDNKRKMIRGAQTVEKENLEKTKEYIKSFLLERTQMKKDNKKFEAKKIEKCKVQVSSSKEIDNLKKMLEQKRKLRIQMTG